jgi:predicted amidophosphoribosyltransferase
MIKVRNISIIQAQMSNSDSEHDYGEFRLISQYLDENIDKYILFEDIIYQGTTTEGVIKHLESQKKEILGIYHW